MTNVRTTLAKNSEDRLSLMSAADRMSAGKEVYAGATGCDDTAFVCSSRSCACKKSFLRP